ncbi:hypothetical protein BC30048_2937 [Bacillus cereus]|uniref:hypothetical protein n=1 Tax=Bacillus cereus TaxID=1396 RepID=UPI001BA6DF5D|nr:hypothetical protein [Bacillus cereus]MBR9685753.1 hypothetical protein [Bacillus cereus]MEB9966470.1 hypothetical protein [Bacillus cereus]BCD00035.1 hypothetical protein BC30048_2937 [Bacillus cereus]
MRMAVQRNAKQLSQLADIVTEGLVRLFITGRLPLRNLVAVHEKIGQTREKAIFLIKNNK